MHFFFFFQAEDGIRALYVTGVQTCALPISAPGAGGPAGAGTAAPSPGPQTAVLSVIARQWGQLGLGRRIGGLWQRSVGRAWQQTIGRLGISRLWQPGPGVREAADSGVRSLALVTAMPVILLVAWLVPGLVLLLV